MNSEDHRLPIKAKNRLFDGLEKGADCGPVRNLSTTGADIAAAIYSPGLSECEPGSNEQDKESEWTGPFYFIQGADCQFGLIDIWTKKSPPIGWEEEIRLTRIAVSRINQMQPKPRFFSLCGDLVHAYPGQSNRIPQEGDFLKEISKLDPNIPLVYCCGNHDICNTPTEETIRQFREKFGDDYLSFWAGGIKCLVLNSQYYAESSEVKELCKEHDDWLEKQLNAKEECTHLVIFQHIPWFLQDVHEEDSYFNLPTEVRVKMLDRLADAEKHTPEIEQNEIDGWINKWDPLIFIFLDIGVKAIFCGHYHRNVRRFYKGMEQIVTCAMGCPTDDDRPGLMVVKVTEDSIKHKYYAMEDIPIDLDAETF